MRSLRFWVIILLLTATALVLHVRGDVDKVPASRPLSQLPSALDGRIATDFPLDAETLAILGNGVFLNREYIPNKSIPAVSLSDRAPIGLYIAYFPTQRTGQSIHSPQNCLPGAGWTIQSSQITKFTAAGKTYQANDNLITNGNSTQEVIYWYQLHGRSIASDYQAKIDTLTDSIRYGRTDEALVRITTAVMPSEGHAEARDRVVNFAQQIIPVLPEYVPN